MNPTLEQTVILRPLFLAALVFLTSCARSSDKFYFGNYSEAEQLYTKGDFEKAIEKYQAYIDENPEGNLAVISLYYMAKSHAALGHTDQAETLYRKIIAEHPKLVWANFSETQLKELQSKAEAVKPAS